MSTISDIRDAAERAVSGERRIVRGYNPMDWGARCDICPLREKRDGGPVPPEFYSGAKVMVVAEAPGEDEVAVGRPLVGRSGVLATQGMMQSGYTRDTVTWNNALLCRPPGNELGKFLHRLQKENKAREKRGEAPLANPIDCCRPRLHREAAQFPRIVAMGKTALTALTTEAKSIMAIRGTPIEGQLNPVLGTFTAGLTFGEDAGGSVQAFIFPTLHPAHALRFKRWIRVFFSDLGRAGRWFANDLKWPAYTPENYLPSPKEVADFLFGGAPFYAYDVETNAKEALIAKLRCIGFATTEGGIVVPFRSIEGGYSFYSPGDMAEIEEILRQFFTANHILKVGHNAGYYDRIVIEEQLGVTPAPLTDTIMLHRSAESELPHDLGFIGSVYTDVTKAWKAGNVALTAKTDHDLHAYCLTDCVVTARCAPKLLELVEKREQRGVVAVDLKMQAMAVGMHRTGLYVDQAARAEWDRKLRADAAAERMACQQYAGEPDFNPGSVDQVKRLLFDEWGIDPEETTALGDPGTDDESLRAFLIRPSVIRQHKLFIAALRRYRKAVKLRGTYITRMRPCTETIEDDGLAINDEDDDEARSLGERRGSSDPDERAAREAKKRSGRMGKVKEPARGLVMGDGRVHPHWNAHAPVTGRFSSSTPNAQNWPIPIRNMVVPQPGHILVGADMDQIELRMCSGLAKASRYLEVFKKGGDPHALTSEMLYGTAFTHAAEDTRKRLRDFAKRFTYAVLYGATLETVHNTITSAENAKGELLFPNHPLKDTRLLYDKWLGANPEFVKWWEDVVAEWKRQGYLRDACLGRQRDFLDSTLEDTEVNEIINYKAQATAAAIMNLASVDLIEGPLRFDRWGPGTGIIAQIHDALYCEVPLDQEKNAKAWLKEAMTRTVPGMDIVFGAKPKSGMKWNECA